MQTGFFMAHTQLVIDWGLMRSLVQQLKRQRVQAMPGLR